MQSDEQAMNQMLRRVQGDAANPQAPATGAVAKTGLSKKEKRMMKMQAQKE